MPTGPLARLDAWVAANPWHPRILPFIVYIAGLGLIEFVRPYLPTLYPILYAVQCGLVAALLWRYRTLIPEVTLRFHWLAIPTGLGLCVAWVALGYLTIAMSDRFDYHRVEDHYFVAMLNETPVLAWSSLGLRLLGMSLLVPVFEELFTRSAILRGLHRARPTGVGLVQLGTDLPVLGEWLSNTKLGQRAIAAPPQFTRQLMETPVGSLTVFAVFASTLIFMVNHMMRDWLGCIACGVVWCLLLWWTNRAPADAVNGSGRPRNLGLGPIIWSHGITNATLWAYCVYTGDWQWL